MELWGWAQLLTNKPAPFILVVGLHHCIRQFALHLDAAARPRVSGETLFLHRFWSSQFLPLCYRTMVPWKKLLSVACSITDVKSSLHGWVLEFVAMEVSGTPDVYGLNGSLIFIKWKALKDQTMIVYVWKKDAFLAFNHVRRKRDNQQQLGQLEQKAGWNNSKFWLMKKSTARLITLSSSSEILIL